jgi:type II secretory pathway pseudopilin PulG
MDKRERGSVLVQVLMTAVIVAVIAAGMMNLLLMRSQSIQREEERTTATGRTHGALNAVVSGWANNGGLDCTGVPGYTMGGGTAGSCNCTYTSTDGTGIVITATSAGGSCSLSINAPPAL